MIISYSFILDADGLRNYILSHSNYNVCKPYMQSNDFYIPLHQQALSDIPEDITDLILCAYECDLECIDFGKYSFNHLKSISFVNRSLTNHCKRLIIRSILLFILFSI